MNIEEMQALLFELDNLHKKIEIYKKSNSNKYVYAEVYDSWITQYNSLLKQYNTLQKLDINPMSYNNSDLSSSGKTVRETSVEFFSTVLKGLVEKIRNDIDLKRKEKISKEIPPHQMRKCFKLCLEKCPISPEYKKSKVFIAMPFDPQYLDSYNYGIVQVLDRLGYEYYKADNVISNKDLMCKICEQLQICGIAIVNISGLNANVMLELGLAYGLGKPVIIIKDTKTNSISDLGCMEYIEYSNAYELQQKLFKALDNNFL